MADLAMLEVGFDPTPLKDGVRSLEAVVTTAKKTEAAANDAGQSLNRMSQSMAGTSKAAERVAKETAKIDRAMGGLSGASQRVAVEFGKIERAAEQMQQATAAANAGLSSIGASAGVAAAGLGNVAGGLGRAGAAAGAANQNIKLTSGQVQNLGFQINDMGTMLAMGASPFQIMASQAGQVLQVLQEGGGIKASLGAISTAIGGFVSSLGPVGLAIGAATAAAGAMWLMSDGPEAKAAKSSVGAFKDTVDDLRDSFKGAASAADEVFARGERLSQGMALGKLADDLKKAKDEVKAATENLGRGGAVRLDTGTLGSARAVMDLFNSEVRNAQGEIRDLYGLFVRGEIEARVLIERMSQIQLAPGASDRVKEMAGEMRRLGTDVMNAATNAQALQAAMDAIVNSRSRLPKPSAQDRPDNTGLELRFGDRINPGVTDDIRKGLEDQAAALTKTESATRTYIDAVNDQKASLKGSIDELRLQVDMFGQSEGAIAGARFRLDAMAEAQRAANDAKAGAIDPSLVDQINREAAEYGELTDRLKANAVAQREQQKAAEDVRRQQERVADFAADLQFERSIATLPEAEQDVRQSLHRLGVDFDSYEGQRLAAGMRYNAALEEQQDTLRKTGDVAKDVLGGMIDALSQGGDLVGNLISAFAGLGKQLATAGLDRIMGGIFGGKTGQSGAGGLVSGLSSALGSIAANQNTPSASSGVGAVERRILPAFSNASASLTAAAKAIRTIESGSAGGNYSAVGPVTRSGDRALGAYQMMGANLPQWSRDAIGREVGKTEFLKSVELQDKIFEHRFGRYMTKYGAEGASRAWFAGEGGMNKMGAKDVVGTSVVGYNARFTDLYNQHGGGQSYRETSSIDEARALRKGVSEGMVDANKRIASSYDLGGYDSSSPRTAGAQQGMTRGQALMSGLAGVAGIAANGYQSGSPISGGLSGAMGGLELGGSIASAFPSLAGVAGPAGMAIGAITGCVGGKMATRSQLKARKAA